MKKYYYPILIGILAFVILSILVSTFLRKPAFTAEDPSFTIDGRVNLPDQVLAIDMNIHDHHTINESDIANGSSPLIVLIQQDNNGVRLEPRFIRSFDELATLDSNQDGQIDPTDINHKNLYLAYMQPEGNFRYVPLSNTGIYALFLHQSHITRTQRGSTEIILATADIAVLRDSSKRPIVPVLIGPKVLSKLNKVKK